MLHLSNLSKILTSPLRNETLLISSLESKFSRYLKVLINGSWNQEFSTTEERFPQVAGSIDKVDQSNCCKSWGNDNISEV